MHKIIRGLIFFLAIGLAACGGDTDFAGRTAKGDNVEPKPKPVEPPPPQPPAELPTPFAALTWFWQCESQVVEPPAGTEESPVVEGQGPHSFIPEKLQGTPITLQGNLCPPEALDRDIVFVIDISGSMNGNDPLVGNSCGRLDAVKKVLSNVPAGIGEFGVVLFQDTAATSTALFTSEADLFTDLAAGGAIETVLCQQGGGTNYQAAINAASGLLAMGRENASKEIYFVSDGQPNLGESGVVEATNLKTNGVNINGKQIPATFATVMLGGQDDVLESQIASLDSNGAPLHAYVKDADQLATTLADLASNDISGGSLKYRAIGATDWTSLDLMTHLNGFEFVLPSFTIEEAVAPDGIEVEYEYFDQRGNRFSSAGILLWELETEHSED
jgi:hypothetical protein